MFHLLKRVVSAANSDNRTYFVNDQRVFRIIFNWPTWPLFRYFLYVDVQKMVNEFGYSRIQTCIIGIEGVSDDHKAGNTSLSRRTNRSR